MINTKCYYPDWEEPGSYEVGKHAFNKDGDCTTCGEQAVCKCGHRPGRHHSTPIMYGPDIGDCRDCDCHRLRVATGAVVPLDVEMSVNEAMNLFDRRAK